MIRNSKLVSAMHKIEMEPIPPFPSRIASDFPLEQLPPFLQRVAIEACRLSMAPLSSIVCGILCALSASAQGLVLVQKRERNISPVSLALIVALESGERKSSSVAPLFSGIREFDYEFAQRNLAQELVFKSQNEAWRSVKDGLLCAIKKEVKKGGDVSHLIEQLKQHEILRPKKVPHFRPLFERVSIAALIAYLSENVQSTSMITDEAMAVLAGSSSQDFGVLNKLYDGASFQSDSYLKANRIDAPSFTFGIWGQTQVINEFITSDNKARGTGFIARCFLVQPTPTSGHRFLSPHEEEATTEALDLFNLFCRNCLELTGELMTNGKFDRQVLRFSHDASRRWHDCYNMLEQQIRHDINIQSFRDLASKQADKVARIAGLFHVIGGDGDIISGETMKQAINVGEWLFNKTILFLKNSQFEQVQKLATELLNWLVDYLRINGKNCISRTTLMQLGPVKLRCRANLLPVLDLLCSRGKIWIGHFPEDRRTLYVGVQPFIPQPSLAYQWCS